LPGERISSASVQASIIEALRSVYDPCCAEQRISVVDMGLIDSVRLDGEQAKLQLVLTSGWCPFAGRLLESVRERIESLPEVGSASVEIMWQKGWSSERLSPEARGKLRFLPDPHEISDRDAYVARHTGRAKEERP
jgi:metal-sulfur cluster biosynthetic enzyme